jgi:hypothetical protein
MEYHRSLAHEAVSAVLGRAHGPEELCMLERPVCTSCACVSTMSPTIMGRLKRTSPTKAVTQLVPLQSTAHA